MKTTEQIKEKLDIASVIGNYIKIEKSGINWKARCPFHNEKTPSFFISSERQSYYCFGCGEKGDIFTFVEKFEGLDFRGALESLAEKAGVEIKNLAKEERVDKKDELLSVLKEASNLYSENLKLNKVGKDYLESRGLTEESIATWNIGYAKDEWRDTHDKLIQKGYSKEILLEAGLIKKVENEEKFYDTFRDRIMFPISDSAGRVIAFSGRSLKKDDKTPKYLNSPETKLFYKSETLYGFHLAKNHIRKLDYAILVEGQMDIVLAHQAGTQNTVASSGTALTKLHLEKILKLSKRIVLCYDSDKAGQNATYKAGKLALSLGMEVKVATLREGEDPASTIKESKEEWYESLKNSKHLVDYALDKAMEEKDEKIKSNIVRENVLPLLSQVQSNIEVSQYIKKIAMRLRVDESAVKKDFEKAVIEEKATEDNKKEGYAQEYTSPKTDLKRIIMSLILLEESKYKEESNIRKKLKDIIGEEELNTLSLSFESEKEALLFEGDTHCGDKGIRLIGEDILKRIETSTLKQRLQEKARVLDDVSITKEEELKIVEEMREIQKKIEQITK